MALPTLGRVLLDTTAGDIDIELWSKVCSQSLVRLTRGERYPQEAPKACRNFIALAMEGAHILLFLVRAVR